MRPGKQSGESTEHKRFRLSTWAKWLLFCSLTLVVGIVLIGSGNGKPPEPSYEGRTLSQCLFGNDYSLRNRHEVEYALFEMGTNALPALRYYLKRGNKLERIAYKQAPIWLQN